MQRSALGDQIRALHGSSRMNSSLNARKGADFNVSDYRGKIMLAVSKAERATYVRARSWNKYEAILSPRYLE